MQATDLAVTSARRVFHPSGRWQSGGRSCPGSVQPSISCLQYRRESLRTDRSHVGPHPRLRASRSPRHPALAARSARRGPSVVDTAPATVRRRGGYLRVRPPRDSRCHSWRLSAFQPAVGKGTPYRDRRLGRCGGLDTADRDVGHCRLNLAVLHSARLRRSVAPVAYEAEAASKSMELRWDLHEILLYSGDWPRLHSYRQVDGRAPVDIQGMNQRAEELRRPQPAEALVGPSGPGRRSGIWRSGVPIRMRRLESCRRSPGPAWPTSRGSVSQRVSCAPEPIRQHE